MDVFAHGLWAYVVFRKNPLKKLAVVTSVMPDILSFGIYLIVLLFTGKLVPGGHEFQAIPNYVTFMYNITHSLFIAGFFGIFFYLKYKKYIILALAWMMHITLDIFTHIEQFFPTHFLYPMSNLHFSFISWGNKYFMIANYTALMIVYSIILYKHIKNKS